MRVVTDAGPLIHLSWIDRLDILGTVFGEIVVPQAVQQEVLSVDETTLGLVALRAAFAADWIVVRYVVNAKRVAEFRNELGRGESEAIALAEETGADLLLLDDRRARSRALACGLAITGTVGILRLVRERGMIDAAAPILEVLQRRGFYISAEVLEAVQREEGDP